MPLLGQEDFGEAGGDGEFCERGARFDGRHWSEAERPIGRLASFDKVGGEDPLRNAGDGEMPQGAAQVALGIAQLQSPGKHHAEGGA